MSDETKAVEDELVRTPLWRKRRGDAKREFQIFVGVNPALKEALREQAAKEYTTVSTLAERVLAKFITDIRNKEAA